MQRGDHGPAAMTDMQKSYVRVIVVWLIVLAGLYALQVAFS